MLHSFRILYRKEDGTEGTYYIQEETAYLAKLDYRMQTGYEEDSIQCVQMQVQKWVTVE